MSHTNVHSGLPVTQWLEWSTVYLLHNRTFTMFLFITKLNVACWHNSFFWESNPHPCDIVVCFADFPFLNFRDIVFVLLSCSVFVWKCNWQRPLPRDVRSRIAVDRARKKRWRKHLNHELLGKRNELSCNVSSGRNKYIFHWVFSLKKQTEPAVMASAVAKQH